MQLVTILVPQMAKIQKEGESGRKKINQWTRYLTVIVTAFQAAAYIGYLKSPSLAGAIVPGYGDSFFWVSTVVLLTVGTLFVMWLGEKITDKGLGNGTSLIIMVGILARLPQSFMQEWTARSTGGAGGLLIMLVEVFFLIIIMVWIQVGFAMVVLSAAIKAIPMDVTEAALLDGAVGWKLFSTATVSMIRAAAFAVGSAS